MDTKILCKAWRMLVKHGNDVDKVIKAEIRQCQQDGKEEEVRYWRDVLSAVDEFR